MKPKLWMSAQIAPEIAMSQLGEKTLMPFLGFDGKDFGEVGAAPA